MKMLKKTQHMVRFHVKVTQGDITEGECRLAHRCMERVAIIRALREIDPDVPSNSVRVDAGHIKFVLKGYRYKADTPRIAKESLILFDHKQFGPVYVKPHSYWVTAAQTSKVVKSTAERKEQINAARHARAAAGNPDKQYVKLKERVIGFDLGQG